MQILFKKKKKNPKCFSFVSLLKEMWKCALNTQSSCCLCDQHINFGIQLGEEKHEISEPVEKNY